MKYRRNWLTAGLLMAALAAMVGWLLSADPATAREIFRNGKWITVPDDSDVEPAAGQETSQDTADEPRNDRAATPDAPGEEPVSANDSTDSQETGETAQAGAASQAAADAEADTRTSTVAAQAEAPGQSPDDQSDEPSTPATVTAAADDADEAQPRQKPGAVRLSEARSVGEKYRHPEPSRAAEEVRPLLGPAGSARLGPPVPEKLNEAVKYFQDGRYGKARSAAAKYLKQANSDDSGDSGDYGEAAQWIEAEATFSQGDYRPASKSYDTFAENYAGSKLVDKAMLRQMESAEALLGPAKVKVLGIPLLSGNTEAMDILHKLYSRSPTGPLAADALFRIGEHRFSQGDYIEAQEVFERFTREFPNHNRTRQAELLAAQSGMNAVVAPNFDISTMQRSKEILQRYQQKYPALAAEENVEQALQAIDETEAAKRLEMARYYNRAGHPRAAAFYARRVIERHGSTPQAAEARTLLEKLEDKPAKEQS